MSLRARLHLAGGLIILILLVPNIYGLVRLFELRSIAVDLQTRHAVAYQTLGRIEMALAELNRLQGVYVTAPTVKNHGAMYAELDTVETHLAHLTRSGYSKEAVGQTVWVEALRQGAQRTELLVRQGRVAQAQAQLSDMQPLFAEAQESLDGVSDVIHQLSTVKALRAQAITSTASQTMSVAFGLALLVALLVAGLVVAAVISPVFRLRSAMVAVAAGNFDPPKDLPYHRKDELGDLCRSFRSMTNHLAELDRLKAEFLSIASHELKSSVGVIDGYAEMLQDELYGPLNGEQRERLAYIRDQTGNLAERVNQLLSLTRMQARGPQLELKDTPVSNLLERIRKDFAPQARQSGIEFFVEADVSAPEVVRVDAERVTQEILGNVVANAFKFTPAGGRIEVWAWGRDRHLVFEVKDTGEGIPQSQLPFVFEKYYQAGHRAQKVGSGLGLAIAREMAEAHGGTIDVRSISGSGTTFQIFLPKGVEHPDIAEQPRSVEWGDVPATASAGSSST